MVSEVIKERNHFIDPDRIEAGLERLRAFPDAQLIKVQKEHSQRFLPGDPSYDEGSAERQRFLCMNLLLNERLLIAPAFRGLPVSPSPKDGPYNEAQELYARDKQLIDLHWLALRKLSQNLKARVVLGECDLVVDGEVSLDNAAEAVCIDWTAKHKAKVLKLSDDEQMEMSIIRSSKVYQRQTRALKNLENVECSLINIANDPVSRFNPHDIPCRLNEYLCLAVAQGSPAKAVHFWPLITGEPKISDRKEIKAAQKRFRDRLDLFERV